MVSMILDFRLLIGKCSACISCQKRELALVDFKRLWLPGSRRRTKQMATRLKQTTLRKMSSSLYFLGESRAVPSSQTCMVGSLMRIFSELQFVAGKQQALWWWERRDQHRFYERFLISNYCYRCAIKAIRAIERGLFLSVAHTCAEINSQTRLLRDISWTPAWPAF